MLCRMRESQIERAVCLYARSAGMMAYKFVSPGRAGVPDRIFLTPHGGVFFVEFKAPDGKLRPLQENEHRVIRKHGHDVYVVDSVLTGKQLIDSKLDE